MHNLVINRKYVYSLVSSMLRNIRKITDTDDKHDMLYLCWALLEHARLCPPSLYCNHTGSLMEVSLEDDDERLKRCNKMLRRAWVSAGYLIASPVNDNRGFGAMAFENYVLELANNNMDSGEGITVEVSSKEIDYILHCLHKQLLAGGTSTGLKELIQSVHSAREK